MTRLDTTPKTLMAVHSRIIVTVTGPASILIAEGDLYAELKIVVPEALTDREKQLFSELAEESPFEARRSD